MGDADGAAEPSDDAEAASFPIERKLLKAHARRASTR